MKHILIFLLLFTSFSVWAQRDDSSVPVPNFVNQKGDQMLSASLGLLNPESFAFSIFGFSGGGNPSPSLNIQYEYAISPYVGIGAFGSFYRVNANLNESADDILSALNGGDIDDIINDLGCFLLGNCGSTNIQERVSVITFGGKLVYHKNIIKDLDTYASTYLGYSVNRRQTITETLLNSVSDQVGLGVNVPTFVYFSSIGARYYFNEKWAAYGEFGYGNSHLLLLGVSHRFNKQNRMKL